MEDSAPNPSPLHLIISASHLRSRLVELDEEIHWHQSRLRLLGAQRQIVLQALDSITYPVLTIPPEITGHIFSFYVENPHIGATDVAGPSPLPLASVCRSWRDICLSMPQLWSSLRLFPRYPGSDLPAFLDLLQLWIPRAGKHLLDLEVSRFPTESTTAILSHLAHYSHQWRTLRLTFPSSSSFPNDKIRDQVPCLTKLSINIIGGYSVPEVVTAVTAFNDAPRLRDVQLFGVSFRSLSLPWIQLTSLNFSGASASNCVQILEQTPNVKVLSVNLPTTSHSFNPRLTLLHLHTLAFQCDRTAMLLDCLTLLALKTIELSVPESEDGLFSLPGLAYRFQWSLRSIHLVGLHSVASTFCLSATRSVEEVEIRHCSTIWWHESLDELVSLLENKDSFLPNVHVLKLTKFTVKVSASSLAAMLTSRWDESREGIAKLETFHLSPENTSKRSEAKCAHYKTWA